MERPTFTITATQALRALFAIIGEIKGVVDVEFAREDGKTDVKYLDESKVLLVASEVSTEIPKDVAVNVADGRTTRWRKLKQIEFYFDGAVFVFPDGVERFSYDEFVGIEYDMLAESAKKNSPLVLDANGLKLFDAFLKKHAKDDLTTVIDLHRGEVVVYWKPTVDWKEEVFDYIKLPATPARDKSVVVLGAGYLYPVIHEVRMNGAKVVKVYPMNVGDIETPAYLEAFFSDGSVLKVAIAPRVLDENNPVKVFYEREGRLPTSIEELEKILKEKEKAEVEKYLEKINDLIKQVEERRNKARLMRDELVQRSRRLEQMVGDLTEKDKKRFFETTGVAFDRWWESVQRQMRAYHNWLSGIVGTNAVEQYKRDHMTTPEAHYKKLIYEFHYTPEEAFNIVAEELVKMHRIPEGGSNFIEGLKQLENAPGKNLVDKLINIGVRLATKLAEECPYVPTSVGEWHFKKCIGENIPPWMVEINYPIEFIKKKALEIVKEKSEVHEELKVPDYSVSTITDEWFETVREFAKKAPRDAYAKHLAEEFGVPVEYLYPEKYFKQGFDYIARDAYGYYSVVRRELRGAKLNVAKANALKTLLETYYERFAKKPEVEKAKEQAEKPAEEKPVGEKPPTVTFECEGKTYEVEIPPFPFERAVNSYSINRMIPEDSAKLDQRHYYEDVQKYAHYAEKYCEVFGPERLKSLIQSFAKAWLDKYTDYLSTVARTPAAHVVGPARMPSQAKLEKLHDVLERKRKAWWDFLSEAKKNLDRWATQEKLKQVGRAGVLEEEINKLKAELEELKRWHEIMKEANRIIRSKRLTKEEKERKLREIGAFEVAKKGYHFFWPEPGPLGRIGFPDFALDSIRNKIKRLEKRIEELERKKTVAEEVEAKGGQKVMAEGEGWKIIASYADDRVWIVFPGPPKPEVRNELKRHGFKWSPTRKAWVWKLTDKAILDAAWIIQKHYNVPGLWEKMREKLGLVPKMEASALEKFIGAKTAILGAIKDAVEEVTGNMPAEVKDEVVSEDKRRQEVIYHVLEWGTLENILDVIAIYDATKSPVVGLEVVIPGCRKVKRGAADPKEVNKIAEWLKNAIVELWNECKKPAEVNLEAKASGAMSAWVPAVDKVAKEIQYRLAKWLRSRGVEPQISVEKKKDKYPWEYDVIIEAPFDRGLNGKVWVNLHAEAAKVFRKNDVNVTARMNVKISNQRYPECDRAWSPLYRTVKELLDKADRDFAGFIEEFMNCVAEAHERETWEEVLGPEVEEEKEVEVPPELIERAMAEEEERMYREFSEKLRRLKAEFEPLEKEYLRLKDKYEDILMKVKEPESAYRREKERAAKLLEEAALLSTGIRKALEDAERTLSRIRENPERLRKDSWPWIRQWLEEADRDLRKLKPLIGPLREAVTEFEKVVVGRQPEKAKEEISPLEACVSGAEEVLWKAYDAEFKLKGLVAKRPAWLRELAEKVCREEMSMAEAMRETLKRAKIDISEEIFRRVIGKKPEEVVEFEKPPEAEKKPVEEVPKMSVEDELREHAMKIASRITPNPEVLVECLPIVELAHMVQEGRTTLDDAKEVLRLIILEGRKKELLCSIDWDKILPKRGRVDLFKVEEKILAEVEKAHKRMAREVKRAREEVPRIERVEEVTPTPRVEGRVSIPPWIRDELSKPSALWDILNGGVQGFINKIRVAHPDAPKYANEIYVLARTVLDRAEASLESIPNKTFYQALALYMLRTGKGNILSGGIKAFAREYMGGMLAWMRESGPIGRAIYNLYRTHPYIYWTETPGGVMVSFESGTFRVPLGNVLMRLAGASMLRALGTDPWTAIGEPESTLLRESFELIGEWVRRGA